MRNLGDSLKNKSVDYDKLIEYGFVRQGDYYVYTYKILDEQFEMIVSISDSEQTSKLIDIANDDEYILVDVPSSVGEFVGRVREEYENKLQDIIETCTTPNVFKSKQSKEVIKYVKDKYDDNLEFLWKKFEGNAVWRNKLNNKWYGALLILSERKLGIDSDNIVDIIDLRYQKNEIEKIVDFKKIFPGYHMNKKSWITIKLDGTVENDIVFNLIDNSYRLSVDDKTGKKMDELETKVLEYLTIIPHGKVVTYKQVAEYLGNPGLARVVGNILHKNPDGDKYPCYKVLNSQGMLAEAFVFGGANKQKERLEKDGIEVHNNKVDLSKYQWNGQ